MKKNYDFIFILLCIFVFRIILLSSTYPDAICIIAILGYIFGNKLLEQRKLDSDIKQQISNDRQEINKHIEILANELTKVKNTTESIKAATGFLNKR